MEELTVAEVREYVPPVEDAWRSAWIAERHRRLDENDEHMRKIVYIQEALERISRRLDVIETRSR